MSSDRRERVKELLSQAARLAPAQRRAFVEQAAGDDAQVAAEALELLLTLDDPAFLGAPTVARLTATEAPPATATRAAPAVEEVGARIGRYKLLQRIGEGGFGTVFMAEQTEPVVRRVALKVIKAGMDTRQVIARFEAERQALALMDHPSIAKVLDAGETDFGRPYFVMELVRGEPITAYCDSEQLPVRQRLELFRSVCHAVQHAHQKGVIHRDIKPSNVLVTLTDGQPRPKVIDFGIAKATAARLTEKTLFTELHTLVGTPAYMSPEQADLSSADIDTRSDVYSLGVLLYELLTGTTPFDAAALGGFAGLIRRIREEEPPRPSLRLQTLASSSARKALPEAAVAGGTAESSAIEIARRRRCEPPLLVRMLRGDLDWIVMRCLEKDRRRRYETASALAQDIDRYLAHEPVSATPPGAAYRLRKFVRRNRAAVIGATAVASILLLATIGMGVLASWALREGVRAAEAADRAETEARNARSAEAEQRLARDEAEQQRAVAERRAEETLEVADFQSRMLREIDVEAMGRGIRELMHERVRAALARQYVGEYPDRRARTAEEVETELAAYDERAEAAQAVDVARGVMDEYVLKRAGEALEAEFADQPLVQAQILDALGTTYEALGLVGRAEPYRRRALELRQCELGPEHEPVAASLHNLAVSLWAKGEYAAAEPLYRQALELRRRLLGAEHVDVAATLHGLGTLLADRGEAASAEPLLREALALRRRLSGDEHLDVASTLNNLAELLVARGDTAGAEPLYREALALHRKHLGDEHPRVASSLNNLAELLSAKGDTAAAEPLYREALAMYRKFLGDEHPNVAQAMNNLAAALYVKGDYTAAEPLYRESLALLRKRLGDEHPRVATSLNNLGLLLKEKGDYAAAEPLLRESLALRRQVLGEARPQVAVSLNNLAMLLEAKGDTAGAEALYREALALRRRVLGETHPDVAKSLNNLANFLREKGDPAAAEPLFREALESCRALLGDEHPHTQYPRRGLAQTLTELRRFEEAEALLLEAAGHCKQSEAVRRMHWPSVLASLVELYDAWHAAEPAGAADAAPAGGPSHAAQAAEWRTRLADWEASTQPASRPVTGEPAAGRP